MKRTSYLVGTIPADTPAEAMSLVLPWVGHTLRFVPDGETSRPNWIQEIIDDLGENHLDLEVARAGDWFSGYKHIPRLRIRKGHTLEPGSLDLGYHTAYMRSEEAMWDWCKKYKVSSDLQVGIPGDLDLAVFSLGFAQGTRHQEAFTKATAREIEWIYKDTEGNVVFQLEVPFETCLLTIAPGPLRPLIARWLAQRMLRVVHMAPAGARFGVHMCLGDLDHKALGHPRNASPLVILANAIWRAWPKKLSLDDPEELELEKKLEYIHFPFGEGEVPPSLEWRFYHPLSRLKIPDDVELVAGCLHESLTSDQVKLLIKMIEWESGRVAVSVAASCGLSRRTPDDVLKVLRQTAEVCAEAEGR